MLCTSSLFNLVNIPHYFRISPRAAYLSERLWGSRTVILRLVRCEGCLPSSKTLILLDWIFNDPKPLDSYSTVYSESVQLISA